MELGGIMQQPAVWTLALAIALGITVWSLTSSRRRQQGQGKAFPSTDDTAPQAPSFRNFTLQQLNKMDGSGSNGSTAPLAIAVRGEVFDVSRAKGLFGPGGSYHMMAGHDASRNLAKMSFDPKDLDTMKWDNLTAKQEAALDSWLAKCRRTYPYLGKVVVFPSGGQAPRVFSSAAELRPFDGSGPIPENYAAAPIFIAVNGSVFDVSFGGTDIYLRGMYRSLVGRDATVALGKMRLNPSDADDTASLTEEEKATVVEWENSFRHERLYPIVGKLQ